MLPRAPHFFLGLFHNREVAMVWQSIPLPWVSGSQHFFCILIWEAFSHTSNQNYRECGTVVLLCNSCPPSHPRRHRHADPWEGCHCKVCFHATELISNVSPMGSFRPGSLPGIPLTTPHGPPPCCAALGGNTRGCPGGTECSPPWPHPRNGLCDDKLC